MVAVEERGKAERKGARLWLLRQRGSQPPEVGPAGADWDLESLARSSVASCLLESRFHQLAATGEHTDRWGEEKDAIGGQGKDGDGPAVEEIARGRLSPPQRDVGGPLPPSGGPLSGALLLPHGSCALPAPVLVLPLVVVSSPPRAV